MSKSSSDSTLKGLNWAGPKERSEKVEDEELTKQYHADLSGQASDLKGLFSQDKEGAKVKREDFPAPVIKPSLSPGRRRKPVRPKNAPSNEGASYKEPPAAAFGSTTKPPAIAPAPSKAVKQAARGLFGGGESDGGEKPALSSPVVSVPPPLKHAARSPLITPPSVSAQHPVVMAGPEPQAKAQMAEGPRFSIQEGKPHPERDLTAATRPSPSAAHAADSSLLLDEKPTDSFVLPSPLPEKPPLPPAASTARESSDATTQAKRAVVESPLQPTLPLSVEKTDLESFPPLPIKRVGPTIWAIALIGLLIVASGGAAAVYAGYIKLPFEVASLLGAAPKLASGKLQTRSVAGEKPPEVPVSPPQTQPTPPPAIPEAQPTAPIAREEPQVQPTSEPAAAQPANTDAPQVATTEPPQEPVAVIPSIELKSTKDLNKAIAQADGLVSKGELTEAEERIRAILQKEPDEHHAMEVLVRVLLKRGKAAEARPFAKRIVDKRPRRAPYRILYGDVLDGVGERSAAEAQWREALVIEPGSPAAKRRLGVSQ